jgi:hypothetical protein
MDIVKLLWISWLFPLFIAAFLEIRIIHLKFILKTKYQIVLPENAIGGLSLGVLKRTFQVLHPRPVKEIILKILVLVKWIYVFLIAATLIFILPRILL